ncbi:MAG: hypothetical protein C0426_01220 [Rhodobacter sp.]|nr:hypothetical protein [Rhodobacter sp.]
MCGENSGTDGLPGGGRSDLVGGGLPASAGGGDLAAGGGFPDGGVLRRGRGRDHADVRRVAVARDPVPGRKSRGRFGCGPAGGAGPAAGQGRGLVGDLGRCRLPDAGHRHALGAVRLHPGPGRDPGGPAGRGAGNFRFQRLSDRGADGALRAARR